MMKQQKTLVTLAQAQAWHPECILSRKADGETFPATFCGETVLFERMKKRSGGIYTLRDLSRFSRFREFLLAFDVDRPDGARDRLGWLRSYFDGVPGGIMVCGIPAFLVESSGTHSFLASTMADGAEGVVCRRPDDDFYTPFECFKKSDTHDLVVVGVDYATGSLELETTDGCPRGNCPCRQCVPVGSIVEVSAMGLTANRKLREPRFLRIRHDKIAPVF